MTSISEFTRLEEESRQADDPSSRYLDVDGVVVWDNRQHDGSRHYSRFLDGRWEQFPSAQIMDIINLGKVIDTEQAAEMIGAAELARTGCAFNDYPLDD